jgi:hypothetical protein
VLRHPVIGIVAGLVLAVALTAMGHLFYPAVPRGNEKLHQEVGRELAKATLALLQPGGRVTVITRDTTVFKQPALESQLASFQKTLANSGVKPAEKVMLQVDPLPPVEVPAGDFRKWIRKTPAGSVLVSFLGPPLLDDAERQKIGVVNSKIVAFCSGSFPGHGYLKTLMEQGLLHAVVVENLGGTPASHHSKASGLGFEDLYITVTSANVNRLVPAESSGRP